jgi:two-component system phosphate regulon sensor histidine kinase PhoR
MKKKRRLFSHLYIRYLTVIILSLGGVTWYTSKTMRQYYFNQTAADLTTRAQILKKQFILPIQYQKEATVDRHSKELGRVSSTRITVILPDGRVIGDSVNAPATMDNHANRPEIKAALAGRIGSAVRFSTTINKNLMYVAVPLIQNGQPFAVLRTSVSVSSIDEKLHDIQFKIGLAGLVFACLAAIVCLLITRRISQPVEEIKNAARRFAEGDLDHKLPSFDLEEMSSLRNSINAMAARLDDRFKTIARQRYERDAILSSMIEGVLAFDNEERVLFNNSALTQIINQSPKNLVGRSIQEIIRSPDLQRFVQQALNTSSTSQTDITLYLNGEKIVRVYSSPLKDAEDQQIGTLLVLNDVTQIRYLENMRRDFATNVSHEIKTPLTAIKGFVETLLDSVYDNPKETKKFVKIIHKHVNRLVALTDDLINLSRIETQYYGSKTNLKLRNVHRVLQKALAMCSEKAKTKNINIQWNCNEDLKAFINADLLAHAIVNLIDNAINYSDKNSTIEVWAGKKNQQVFISVEDHGLGIAKSQQDRIFERFFRVDKARSRKKGGTGLGLAIVKHIVRAHDGQIQIESSLGKGSLFTIYLPG